MRFTPASGSSRLARIWRPLSLALAAGLVAGCDFPLIHPKGLVADQQRDLMITSLLLMLIVVVPVIVLTLVFTFRYRADGKAKYDPDWDHSSRLELVWWGVPIVIIVILASITWTSSHELDPYRELKLKQRPVEIQVVALPWKWLFLYPEQGVATVNHVRFPVDAPVNFKITAQAPMNSFWIPHLAGQIYAMEGMQTKLSVKANDTGSFPGYSANFSGEGHNDMKFVARSVSRAEFDAWVDSTKKAGGELTRQAYDALAKPSIAEPVRTWANFQPGLFLEIMMAYMAPPGGGADGMECCRRKVAGGEGLARDGAATPGCPRHGAPCDSAAMADCPRHAAGDGGAMHKNCHGAAPESAATAPAPGPMPECEHHRGHDAAGN